VVPRHERTINSTFFTNNRFSRNARKYADRYGIITRDGEQVVEDIIRLSKIEPWFTIENEKLIFYPKKFKKHLNSMPKKKK
jgi:hypothetical protein